MDTENQRAAWELLWPQPQVLRGGLGFWTSKGTPSLREETGDRWSEPFGPVTQSNCLSFARAFVSGGPSSHQACLALGHGSERGLETRGTTGRSDGWVASPGNVLGACQVRPGPSPAALKTTPVYLGAGQETYRLPLPPLQTVGRGMKREGPGTKCPFQNFLQKGAVPREGLSF